MKFLNPAKIFSRINIYSLMIHWERTVSLLASESPQTMNTIPDVCLSTGMAPSCAQCKHQYDHWLGSQSPVTT